MGSAATKVDPHDDCFVSRPCEGGNPSTCRFEPARRARAQQKQGEWGRLVVKQEPGGLRHYLEGRPVHCGVGLELQQVAEKSDDWGEFTVPQQVGTIVRYEATQAGGLTATLHALVAGYEFVTSAEPWMRFRWPRRGGQ